MFECSRPARGDDRNVDGGRHSPRQFQVVTVFCTIAIHACQKNFSGAEAFGLAGPAYGVFSRWGASAVNVNFPVLLASFGVNGDNDALTAETRRPFGNEFRVLNGGGIY